MIKSFDVDVNKPIQELVLPPNLQLPYWSHSAEGELEKLCLSSLDLIFKSAMKLVVFCGYSEDIVRKVVLRAGHYYGPKDTLSNIVDNMLVSLQTAQEIDMLKGHLFENLEQLENYILAEMVCVVREVKPLFSTSDAMWWLLTCDMNVRVACTMEGFQIVRLGRSEASGSSSVSASKPRNLAVFQWMSDATSNSIGSTSQVSGCSVSGTPFENIVASLDPGERQDEMIMKLISRKEELQFQVEGWKTWGNHKVMIAAYRLSMVKGELNTLRQEKEKMECFKKEQNELEEYTLTKLSAIENALSNATAQLEQANTAIRRLEVENAKLRKEMEEAKVQAKESATSCQEVSEREKKAKKKSKGREMHKDPLQEELAKLRCKRHQLEQELSQAGAYLDQLEARRKQEHDAKEELLRQAERIRREREQIESKAALEENVLMSKAENDLKKYKDDIKILETQISQLRLNTDALPQQGVLGRRSAAAIDGTSRTPQFQVNSGDKAVKRERECIMCLAEERSVVFLPCAHQVVCPKCNELHEKHGMKECPTCRTLIQVRFRARFARP